MWIFAIVSFILSMIFVQIFKRLAIKFNIYDNPDMGRSEPLTQLNIKIHKKPIPLLGGLGISTAVFITLIIASSLGKGVQSPPWRDVPLNALWSILICGVLTTSLGLVDDIKWKNRPDNHPAGLRGVTGPLTRLANFKFGLQIIIGLSSAIVLFLNGIQLNIIPINIISIIIGTFYICGGMNAINLQDGIDGLAGTIVAISLVGFAILGALTDNTLGIILSLILLGAVLGFLPYNFHPASMFMGDNGSYFLGFMIALLAIIFASNPYDFQKFIGVVFIIGLPVFDVAYAVLRRKLKKELMFEGDRGHLYDKLNKKLTVKNTVIVYGIIQIVLVTVGIFICRSCIFNF